MSTVEQLGYPAEAREDVLDASERRFRENAERFGAGKNWLNGDEARWHVWKACDELFTANDLLDAADRGDGGQEALDAALGHYGDALNHLLMAYEIAENRVRDA